MPDTDAPKPRFNPLRTSVLVVDDQPFFRALLCEILRTIGVQTIVTAQDGAEALKHLDTVPPDIVLADWVMPDMDGLAMTRTIRALRGPIRTLPIILVTANNRASQIAEARQAGVDEILVKPVTVKGVADRMRLAIENRRPFVEVPGYAGPCRRRIRAKGSGVAGRRLLDPLESPEAQTLNERLRDALSAELLGVHGQIEAIARGKPGAARKALSHASEAQRLLSSLGDRHAQRAAKSLNFYLKLVDDQAPFDPKLAGAHVSAVARLLAIPAAQPGLRDRIVDRLEALVNAVAAEDAVAV